MGITLRKATLLDSEMVLAWRNEVTTIPWMAKKTILSPSEHNNWFNKVINDPNCLFLIIEKDHKPCGQIRYQKDASYEEKTVKVSLNITHKMHGKGIASDAFRQGSILVRRTDFAKNIFAYVNIENIASIKAMENAGYVREETILVHGVKHLIMKDYQKD